MRAECKKWSDIAEKLGHAPRTVRGYKQIPGFDALVDHFREELRSERLEEHWHQGVTDALDAQREAIEGLKGRADRLRARLESGEAHAEEAAAYEDVLEKLARVSDSYLINLGFRKGEKERRKLQAQEEETGEPGDRVNVHEADRFDDLEDDELKDRISELESIVGDTGDGET